MSGPNDPNNPGGGSAPGQWQPGQGQPGQGQPGQGQPGQGQPGQGDPWGQQTYGYPSGGQPAQGPPPQQGWGQQPPQQQPPQQQPQPTHFGQPGQQYGQPSTPQYGQQQYGGQQPNYAQQPQYGAPQGQSGQFDQPGQYGQPSQFGQQPGQFGQPGQPGGDQFAGMASPKKSKKLPLIIGAAVVGVIAVVLAVTAFWLPGFAVTKVLSQSAAEQGVTTVLENDYQAKDVADVQCPKDQEIKKGNTFTCTATVAGAKQQVKITFLDDDGKYEVGQPTAQ